MKNQNIALVWGQIRVSAVNLDISEDEFKEITRRMVHATQDLLGPDSEIRKRYDAAKERQ